MMSWLNQVNTLCTQKQKICHELLAIDGLFAANFVVRLPETKQSQYGDELFTILAVLNMALREGHTCVSLTGLANKTFFDFHSATDAVDENRSGLSLSDKPRINTVITECLVSLPEQCFHYHNEKLYLYRYFEFENAIADGVLERVNELAATLSTSLRETCKQFWPILFPDSEFTDSPDDAQQQAVISALTQSTLIINGGPGTGKTYTAARVLALLGLVLGKDKPITIKLAAPTGKAAQRLTESMLQASQSLDSDNLGHLGSLSAVTLHRLLGLRKGSTQVRYDKRNPLHCDILLVDEASMIDTALMARLFRALAPETRLILLGDANQLPSVEAGSVLEDLVNGLQENSAAVVTLTKSRRFSGDLGEFAQACLAGNGQSACEVLSQSNVMEWDNSIPTNTVLKVLAQTDFASITKAKSLAEAFAAIHQTRWLTPFRRGEWGVEGLNQRIEDWVFNRTNSHFKGRVIMVTENHGGTGLFNGDVGIVWPSEAGRLTAYFEQASGSYKAVPLSRLPSFESAFAMTIHKSQGSEFAMPRLVLPDAEQVSDQAWRIVSKALIYTAVTRAKEKLGIVSSKKAITRALSIEHARMSGLAERIARTV